MRGKANLPTRRWRSPYTEVLSSLRGGCGLPTWRVASPYVEGLGSLHGVSGGAVGAGGFVVGDGAAGGDMICRRTGRGAGGRAGARPSQGWRRSQ